MADGMDLGFDLGSVMPPPSFGGEALASLGNLSVPDMTGGFPMGGGLDQIMPQAIPTPTAPNVSMPGAGGGGGWLNQIAGLAKDVVPFAQLGLTGLGIGSGIQNMLLGSQQQQAMLNAQKQQQQTAAPAAAAGSELTAAGTNALLGGPLPPELESQVQQKLAEMKAQIRSYFASAGIADSSMMAEYEGWISMQENALRSQLAQNLLQSGYTGVATALGPSSAVERSALATQGGVNQTLQSANAAIAQLTGSQRPTDQNA